MAASVGFAYKGRDAAGKIVKGTLDATSEAAVAARLRTMGLSPVSIDAAPDGTGLSREITIPGLSKGVGLKDLAVMSRQMATMTSAGLSLMRTLSILSEQTESKPLARILGTVRDDVETGVSLSDAMRKHDRDFPPIMINMVKAGETGGFLDKALETVATNFEKEAELKNTIKSAMTYPVVVVGMVVIAVAGMLIFIVPVFKEMFEGMGGSLPLPTQLLVTMSEQMIWFGPLVLVGSIVFSIWWKKNKHTEAVRKVVDPVKLKIPVFGGLMTKLAVARFSRNFADMIGAGVPILQALQIVGETSGNYVIERSLKGVADSVRQGKSIAAPLADESVFPPMVVQMVAVGEDSGALQQMLDKIADFYDQEVKTMTDQLTSLIEPLLIAFLGIVVGGMIVALYLPIFNIATVMQ
ncbi:type II secretion system F family protein [Mycetocola zhadangensis]|uniref:Type II secretion system F family protein n=1 Tax=Mycetocola zhadangensis TaxID=1164595 RepID=A0A3L7J7C1_9MICO|nr:type II secretion system F family protein [Mycetocola zhadangensis]RLQ85351.1 type II secretion system F family protein [Mycetocola zhadangensis]GGE81872.1 type II secretion system protein F [Mycetocola zhadangensis]